MTQIEKTAYDENTCYTITVDGKEIGIANVLTEGESNAYLERTDINEDRQGQGYGTQLIKAIAKDFGEIYTAPSNDGA